jgi:quinolinate synthase
MKLDLIPLAEQPRDVQDATRARYEPMKLIVPEVEWDLHAPYVAAINELKKQHNAIVLAHNYQTTEIFHGVADLSGDSLALAQLAVDTDADVIVLAGVHFMAETAKLLNPEKKVLIPDPAAGCSLADSITAADVRLLRERYPDAPVVTYVNTSAEVKAESDICCTSSNAVEVVESLGVERVIFLPDEFLGKWVAQQTGVDVILWKGHCIVHERFTPEEIRRFRAAYEGIEVLAHPECPPEVLAEADYVGSRVLMVTECSMADNVAVENPGVEMVRPCNICPYMNTITLPKILHSLQTLTHEVTIDPAVAGRARLAVERMLAVGRGRGG